MAGLRGRLVGPLLAGSRPALLRFRSRQSEPQPISCQAAERASNRERLRVFHEGDFGQVHSAHRQDHFAFRVAGLKIGHRLFGFGKREDAVDDDFKLLRIDE